MSSWEILKLTQPRVNVSLLVTHGLGLVQPWQFWSPMTLSKEQMLHCQARSSGRLNVHRAQYSTESSLDIWHFWQVHTFSVWWLRSDPGEPAGRSSGTVGVTGGGRLPSGLLINGGGGNLLPGAFPRGKPELPRLGSCAGPFALAIKSDSTLPVLKCPFSCSDFSLRSDGSITSVRTGFGGRTITDSS